MTSDQWFYIYLENYLWQEIKSIKTIIKYISLLRWKDVAIA
ncbi:hypothetical protein [Scytonema sp. UIC 10036]|nr:hypothetical protein [Scytonema sp. UIC 10036]